MNEPKGSSLSESAAETIAGRMSLISLLNHLRNSQNLLTYMIFTAWCKFMGVSQYIPTVTVG